MIDNIQELDEILEQHSEDEQRAVRLLDNGNITAKGRAKLSLKNKADAKQAVIDWHNKQTNEAIYGFHVFVMDADIIRPETDQAFNYGRLHRAIDDYIAERNKLNKRGGHQ